MIRIVVKRGAGDKEAQPIEDERIVTEQMAIRRGANFINESYYRVLGRSLRVPHREGINDRKIAEVSENKIPIVGNNRIRSVTINLTPKGIWNDLEIAGYEDFADS